MIHKAMLTRSEQALPATGVGSVHSFTLRLLESESKLATTSWNWDCDSAYLAICNIAALYGYGTETAIFHASMLDEGTSPSLPPLPSASTAMPGKNQHSSFAVVFAMQTLEVFLHSDGDQSTSALHVQTWMIFLLFIIRRYPKLFMESLERDIPWRRLVDFINITVSCTPEFSLTTSEWMAFPQRLHPVGEDFLFQGLLWASDFFPHDYFATCDEVDEDCCGILEADVRGLRMERVLYLAIQICLAGGFLTYDEASRHFDLDATLLVKLPVCQIRF